MDFSAARNRFNTAFQDIREQVERTLREQVEKTFREELARSKAEAISFWNQAIQTSEEAAREVKRFSSGLATEVTAEVKVVGDQLQAHLVSGEFETQVDELLDRAGLKSRYEAVHKRRQRKTSGNGFADFATVNASVEQDPVENADPFQLVTEGLAERKERIREKLAFLYKHYCEDVLKTAKAGAFIGSVLGPHTALRLALWAGGLKLGIILGGVTYTVVIKPTGDWMAHSQASPHAEAAENSPGETAR